MKNAFIAVALLFTASALFLAAQPQADLVKKKAKDLKKNVEAGQTNSVAKTNAPARH